MVIPDSLMELVHKLADNMHHNWARNKIKKGFKYGEVRRREGMRKRGEREREQKEREGDLVIYIPTNYHPIFLLVQCDLNSHPISQ